MEINERIESLEAVVATGNKSIAIGREALVEVLVDWRRLERALADVEARAGALEPETAEPALVPEATDVPDKREESDGGLAIPPR